MAEVLEEFPWTSRRGASKYKQFMDGQIWRLNWREETGCTTGGSVTSGFHTAARSMGWNMRTHLDGDDHIIVQAYKEE